MAVAKAKVAQAAKEAPVTVSDATKKRMVVATKGTPPVKGGSSKAPASAPATKGTPPVKGGAAKAPQSEPQVKRRGPAISPDIAEADKPKKPTVKLPKTMAGCADRLWECQQARYALNRQIDALEAEEKAIREYAIQNLPKSNATGVAGKLARIQVESKEIVSAKDFDATLDWMLAHVKKNQALRGIVQRRINTGMVGEMLAEGTKIPGCEMIEVPVVRVSKLK